jgi:hypothetical protein
VFSKTAQTLRNWSVLIKEGRQEEIDFKVGALDRRGARPPRIGWTIARTTSSLAASFADRSLLDYNAAEGAPMSLPPPRQ